ncbi:hypothetical protein, partial [Stenotrophomonas maltophilia]|uniref:hypothetical protein n=1 Tax=Stenotrophomonas maltophilia TaxID=40324 RepID=UPI001953791A
RIRGRPTGPRKAAPGDHPQEWRKLAQQPPIGGLVAGQACAHQRAPLVVAISHLGPIALLRD